MNTPDRNIAITVTTYDMGQIFKTVVSISREWQDDSMRQFDIPHSSPFLDPMIVREFYLTILEWGIDCVMLILNNFMYIFLLLIPIFIISFYVSLDYIIIHRIYRLWVGPNYIFI